MDLVPSGCQHDLDRAADVRLVARQGIGDRPRDRPDRGQVDDRVAARRRVVQRGGVQDGALDELDPVPDRIEPPGESRRQVVDDGHLVARRQQRPHEMMADEASSAGDQDPHVTLPATVDMPIAVDGRPTIARRSPDRDWLISMGR